ncbi:hypothetical protein NF27_BK00090 [Candidatus Jidaibacter acanthamoeba]|uniref:Uncharacterized protein n=1 Tax=Candidatus Jidaibacter acanthamoebae TaxID=86105 RepID=A0A0C1QQC2_9RICK|nr:hypothetical protein [Candidatus Jidaibacter acanthamoeba]KIE06088.1 hypothetical protein NF27_BK00090 [Candidatus Jidaibacter acanthamoeba]
MEKTLGEVSELAGAFEKNAGYITNEEEEKRVTFEQQIKNAYLEVKEIIHKLLDSESDIIYLKNLASMLIDFYNLPHLRIELENATAKWNINKYKDLHKYNEKSPCPRNTWVKVIEKEQGRFKSL